MRIKLLAVLVMLTPVLLWGSSAAASDAKAESTVALGEVVVTGTRTERKITEVPAAVDVISKEEIEKHQGWNLGEVLENLAGVQAQSSNGAYDTHIIIRGAGAKAAYGVREIMIMVDGIPITDPDSLTRLDVVDTALIERIEVLKGPNSTLYGANAAGGVINIITKDSAAYQGLGFKSAVGSDDGHNFNLSYGGNYNDRLFYFLSGSRRSTDSWRKHNEFDTNQLNAKFDYLIDDTSSVNLLLSYSEADLELPSSLTKEEFEDDPTQASSIWPNCGRNSKTARLTLGYEKEFPGGYEVKSQLYFQNWEHFHPVPSGINDGGSDVFGAELQLDIPHKLWGTENTLTGGFSGQIDDRDSKKYAYRDSNPKPPYTSSDAIGELMSKDSNKVEKWGVYLQESLRPIDDLVIDVGVRYDEVAFDLDEEEFLDWGYIFVRPPGESFFGYEEAPVIIDEAKTLRKFSPRIGVNYTLIDDVSVYGAVGTGFQTPTQGELGTNTDLKPQEAINYEVGLKGRFSGGHSLDVALFYTSIEDEIIKLMDEAGVTLYDNAGETLHQGIELSGKVQVLSGLYLGVSYSYSDFTFEEFEEMKSERGSVTSYSRNGNRMPLVPEHQYSVFLDYVHSSGVNARLNTNTWEKYYVDAANSETYEGFTVVNARLGYDWNYARLFIVLDNIFDEEYAAKVTKSYGTTRYTPAAPRTWMAGISYKF